MGVNRCALPISVCSRRDRRRTSLEEEGLCGADPSVCTQEGVDRSAVLVHGSIKVMSSASNWNGGLVHPPRRMQAGGVTRPAPFEFRYIAHDPAHDGRVGHGDPVLGHHGDEVAVAQAVGDVPANAELDGVGLKSSAPVDRVRCLCLGHTTLLRKDASIYSEFLVNAPEPNYTHTLLRHRDGPRDGLRNVSRYFYRVYGEF